MSNTDVFTDANGAIHSTHLSNEDIREKLLALKRPSNSEAKYVIEAELDDLLELFVSTITEARIQELKSAESVMMTTSNSFVRDLVYVKNRITELSTNKDKEKTL